MAGHILSLSAISILLSSAGSDATTTRTVGPGGDYGSINEAIGKLAPFTEDVVLEVAVTSAGYTTQGSVEYTPLFGGYTLTIVGVMSITTSASYYVNNEVEYELVSDVPDCKVTEYVKGGEVIARRVFTNASSDNQFFINNHLGSTVCMVDEDGGAVAEKFDYYPYGKKVDVVSSLGEPVTKSFTGKEMDRYNPDEAEGADGEGWYYFGARYYDADVGVWTSVDPVNQFWNSYSYSGNGINPIWYKDKNGLEMRPLIVDWNQNGQRIEKPLSDRIDLIIAKLKKDPEFAKMWKSLDKMEDVFNLDFIDDYYTSITSDDQVEVGFANYSGYSLNDNKLHRDGGVAMQHTDADVGYTIFHEIHHWFNTVFKKLGNNEEYDHAYSVERVKGLITD